MVEIKDVRYRLCPQMSDYDKMKLDWAPYCIFFNDKLFVSKSCNTDRNGYRWNYKKNKLVALEDLNNYKGKISLINGASVAFGVGATSDKTTISGFLNEGDNGLFINFGGRAINSFQEITNILMYYNYLKNVQNIIFISGINDLALFYADEKFNSITGSFFFQNTYFRLLECKKSESSSYLSLTRMKLKKILQRLGSLKKNDEPILITEENKEMKKISLNSYVERNFQLLGLLKNRFQIHYFLQPFANWTNKKFSEEERVLFSHLDVIQNEQWKILKSQMDLDYLEYRNLIKRNCKLNSIKFYDLNADFQENDWLFVDRIHMNDKGNEKIAKIVSQKVLKAL